jgi:hypothetical protein
VRREAAGSDNAANQQENNMTKVRLTDAERTDVWRMAQAIAFADFSRDPQLDANNKIVPSIKNLKEAKKRFLAERERRSGGSAS